MPGGLPRRASLPVEFAGLVEMTALQFVFRVVNWGDVEKG
jgi:hypothetical protein